MSKQSHQANSNHVLHLAPGARQSRFMYMQYVVAASITNQALTRPCNNIHVPYSTYPKATLTIPQIRLMTRTSTNQISRTKIETGLIVGIEVPHTPSIQISITIMVSIAGACKGSCTQPPFSPLASIGDMLSSGFR
jgi:hypothetical protein